MTTILVASDLTDRSAPAIARAVLLAATLPARLVAVTALDPDADGATVAAARPALLAALAARPEAAGVDYAAEAYLGPPDQAIPAAAAAVGAELLVLGLHRPRVLDTLRLTTMERMLAAARCPVLLARAPAPAPYARILALTAFGPSCAAAILAARRLAPAARMQLLHAQSLSLADRLHPDRAAAEAAEAAAVWAARLPPEVPAPMIVPGGLHELLALAVEEFRPDLLALGASSRSDPGALGHHVRDLIRDPPADVLVARAGAPAPDAEGEAP